MTANEIREVIRAQPFQPFTIYMDDGSSYLIEHPDDVAMGNIVAIDASTDTGRRQIHEAIDSAHFPD